MPAPGGIDKQLDTLFGDGLVEEPVDGAIGDLGRQRCLIIDAAGDNQHQVRKL